MRWQHFDFIYKEYLNQQEARSFGTSYAGFARFLGVSNGRVQTWREGGKWPGTEDIALLHKKMGFAYHWLVTGEGDPYGQEEGTPAISADDSDEGVQAMQARMQEMERELAEERRLNRQLTARLLVDGVGDKGVANSTGKAGEGRG